MNKQNDIATNAFIKICSVCGSQKEENDSCPHCMLVKSNLLTICQNIKTFEHLNPDEQIEKMNEILGFIGNDIDHHTEDNKDNNGVTGITDQEINNMIDFCEKNSNIENVFEAEE